MSWWQIVLAVVFVAGFIWEIRSYKRMELMKYGKPNSSQAVREGQKKGTPGGVEYGGHHLP